MQQFIQYKDLADMYGEGPTAAGIAEQQHGIQRMFQQQGLDAGVQDIRTKELNNLFQMQNDPLKLQNQQLTNEGLSYDVSDKGVKNRINLQTEPLQLDAAQRKLIMEASKADLDGMEIGAQQMAYSPDPTIRAQGEELLRMHREFVKMRDEQKFKAEEGEKDRRSRMDLESMRQRNQNERAAALAQARGAAGQQARNMNLQQRIAHYDNLAFQADQAGDYDLANMYRQEAQYALSQARFLQPDRLAGQVNLTEAGGVPTNPPMPAPQPPQRTPTPAPAPAEPPPRPTAFPSNPPPSRTPAVSAPPSAVQFLKQNPTPEMRRFFDQKYGEGASAKVLGN